MKPEAGCGPNPISFKAIGNEAASCVVDDPSLKSDALRIRIVTTAEQVSGNLF